MESLEANLKLAQENIQAAQAKQKTWYDQKARERVFQVGDEVLWLKPTKGGKLSFRWEGPYKVMKQVNTVDYLIQTDGGPRLTHVNMLKPFLRREALVCTPDSDPIDTSMEGEDELACIPLWSEVKAHAESLGEVAFDKNLAPEQLNSLKQVLNQYRTLFSKLPGRVTGVYHAIHTGEAKPIALTPYRITGPVTKIIEQELQEMLQMGIISPSQSPWAAPVVLVKKRDGTWRFCVDYRRLNQVTRPDAYPMPRLDDLVETMGSARYISTLDLVKGYWQVPMSPEDQHKTAFITHMGLFEFRTLPFGLRNAPATFQRLMDNLLSGLKTFARAYLDDVGVFSATWEDHLEHLSIVFQRLKAAGVTIKGSKCHFGMRELKYLGYIVGGGNIKPEPAKVTEITSWARPKTKRQVRSFLGLVGYYRRFIPQFGTIAEPLTNLTKKKGSDPVDWTDACQQAFEALKRCISTKPVLIAPDFNKPFTVTTDASTVGLGAVLSQEGPDGLMHPILFISRKLIPREQNLSTVERECLAIVWALGKLRPYLWGQPFILQTDHSPLCWLQKARMQNHRLMRWSLSLQDFAFDIQHIKGRDNVVADCLSRKPADETSS